MLVVLHSTTFLLTFLGPLLLTLRASLELPDNKNSFVKSSQLQFLANYWVSYTVISYIQYSISFNLPRSDVCQTIIFACIKIWLFYYHGCFVLNYLISYIFATIGAIFCIKPKGHDNINPNLHHFEHIIETPCRKLVYYSTSLTTLLGLRIGSSMSKFQGYLEQCTQQSFLVSYLNYTCYVPKQQELNYRFNQVNKLFACVLEFFSQETQVRRVKKPTVSLKSKSKILKIPSSPSPIAANNTKSNIDPRPVKSRSFKNISKQWDDRSRRSLSDNHDTIQLEKRCESNFLDNYPTRRVNSSSGEFPVQSLDSDINNSEQPKLNKLQDSFMDSYACNTKPQIQPSSLNSKNLPYPYENVLPPINTPIQKPFVVTNIITREKQ